MTPRVIHWEAEPPKRQREIIDKLLEENNEQAKADRMEREMYGLGWEERHPH